MHQEVWKKLKARVPSHPKQTIHSVVIAPEPNLGSIRIKSSAQAHAPWAREESAASQARLQHRVGPWESDLSREESLDSREFKQLLRRLGIK